MKSSVFVAVWMFMQLMYGMVSCQDAGRHFNCFDEYSKSVCDAFVQSANCISVSNACRKTCGYCHREEIPKFLPQEIIPNCRDTNPQCPTFRLAGFCQRYPNIQMVCMVSCGLCSGGAVKPKPGKWGKWGPYGRCSATCGTGTKKRQRKCIGKGCVGPSSETSRCSLRPCPTVPKCTDSSSLCKASVLSSPQSCWLKDFETYCLKSCGKCPDHDPPPVVCKPWSTYGPCSVTCGTGKKRRRRVCPAGYSGTTISTATCKVTNCPPKPSKGKWGAWGPYGKCSATCGGGTQTRKRRCVGGGNCVGSSTMTRKCNSGKCKGLWSSWAASGKCSKSCGGGTRIYKRKCNNGVCTGPSSKTVKCNQHKCVGSWGPWEIASKCSKSCGGGTLTKTRKCKGSNCKGPAKKVEKCNTKPCSTASAWSKCTKTCGTGSQFRKKSNGIKEYRSCSNQACKNAYCTSKGKRYGIAHDCCPVSVYQPGQETCGRPFDAQRIVGGKNAKEKRWPWMARIDMKPGLCSGVIISQRFLLSAAHCFRYYGGYEPDFGDWKVHFGILKLDKVGLHGSFTTGIRKVTIHPEFKETTSAIRADIAIVELSTALRFTSYIMAICLPGGEVTPTDTKCYATGWGVSDTPGQVTNTLQEVGVQNLKLEACRELYKVDFKAYSDFVNKENRILCAGSLDKSKDSCRGDSGGPLACQRCSSCSWYLAGIVSFGKNDPCGQVPGIYTRVADYEKWIHVVTKLPRAYHSCSWKVGP